MNVIVHISACVETLSPTPNILLFTIIGNQTLFHTFFNQYPSIHGEEASYVMNSDERHFPVSLIAAAPTGNGVGLELVLIALDFILLTRSQSMGMHC